MANEITTYAANLALSWLLRIGSATQPAACYVGLGTGASATGLTGEPSGNGYTREAATWATAASRATDNAAKITFGPCTVSAWGSITHIGIFDASSGGNCLWAGALTASRTVDVGGSLEIAIGDLDVAFNAWSD